MRTEKFKDLFVFAKKSKIKAGEGQLTGSYPFYTSSAKLSKRIDKWQIDEQALIFGTGGKASVHFADERFSTSTDCIIATRKKSSELNIKFIYYYLFGNIHILERGFKGAGLKHISKKYVENIKIPICDLQTQNKIVAILDKASRLLQKREESIQLLDELLRAQFLEMFGDPVLNPKGWKSISLAEIGKFKSGGTPSKKNEEYWSGSFPWVSPKDMKREFIFNSIDHISEKVFEETSLKKIEKENILLVVRGMILAHSFPVAINKVSVSINQDMKAIELSKDFLPIFVLYCLKNMKEFLLSSVSTAGHGTKKFTSESISKIKIIKPQIELQIEFNLIQEKLLATKNKIKNNKAFIQNLFNALLQRAFNGQLNFFDETALNTLLDAIDVEADTNNLQEISVVYLRQFLEKLEEQDFEDMAQYKKAKHAAFQLLQEGRLTQVYQEDSKSVKLAIA